MQTDLHQLTEEQRELIKREVAPEIDVTGCVCRVARGRALTSRALRGFSLIRGTIEERERTDPNDPSTTGGTATVADMPAETGLDAFTSVAPIETAAEEADAAAAAAPAAESAEPAAPAVDDEKYGEAAEAAEPVRGAQAVSRFALTARLRRGQALSQRLPPQRGFWLTRRMPKVATAATRPPRQD
jgi:hypothetical protein